MARLRSDVDGKAVAPAAQGLDGIQAAVRVELAPQAADEAVATEADDIAVTEAELQGNPFLEEWDTPYGVPPFSRIEDGHYMPAIKKGVLEQRAEIEAIRQNVRQLVQLLDLEETRRQIPRPRTPGTR